jgi:hypothetical protein
MRKLILLAVLGLTAVALPGCSSRNGCRESSGGGHFSHFSKLFNRGDRCDDCPSEGYAGDFEGGPQATMMMPSGSPQVLPGPIEIAPTN